MVDKRKDPNKADHLKQYQWKKGESGNPIGRLSQIHAKFDRGEELTPEEKQLMNLRPKPMPPWKKGESGNPNGRPPGTVSLVERLKVYLRSHPEEVEEVVTALVNQGKRGNIVAMKELLDRIDGKVAETHKIEAEIPIRLVFRPAQELLGMGEKDVIVVNEESSEISQLEEGE